MSIGGLAEIFLSKPDVEKTDKESYIPTVAPISATPDAIRVRRNKFAKIHQRKA